MEREIRHAGHQLRRFGPPALLIALIVAAYSNTLGVPLLLDDLPSIVSNPTLRAGAAFADVLFPPPEIYTAGRPLLNLSFALNYAIGGTAVGGYHLINLAIHVLAAFTAFGVVRRILSLPIFATDIAWPTRVLALLVATVWALHPLQTVAVTYISQRAESLMGFFYLLTLYGFLRAVDSGARVWLFVAVGACACGMLTKETMMTAPIIVFLFDWQYISGTPRAAWRQRRSFYLGLAGTWVLLAGLMVTSNLGRRAVGGGQGIDVLDYLQIECVAVVRYLRLAFWPKGLVFDYGANLPVPSPSELLPAALGLIALAAAAAYGLLRRRHWASPLAGFFILLAPTSSIIPVAGQPIAENRLYLPLLAIIGCATFAVGRFIPKWTLWLLGGVAIAFATLAHARNQVFRSRVTIWSDTVTQRPFNQRAATYLAEAHQLAGNATAAIDALLAAIQRSPNSAELHNNVGVALVAGGKPMEALHHFEAAARLNPNLAAAHINRGTVLFAAQQVGPALDALRRGLALDPASADGHYFAGLCLAQLGNPAAAMAELETALRLNPHHAAARTNLESLRTRSGPGQR